MGVWDVVSVCMCMRKRVFSKLIFHLQIRMRERVRTNGKIALCHIFTIYCNINIRDCCSLHLELVHFACTIRIDTDFIE